MITRFKLYYKRYFPLGLKKIIAYMYTTAGRQSGANEITKD